jgi:branched-subunit amino acid ABC-type transport system permease component
MYVLVFCITAGLAAIVGALLGSLYDYGLGTNYSSYSSLTMVAIVVLIVMGDPWYAIVAGITFEVIPGYINIGNINIGDISTTSRCSSGSRPPHSRCR